MWKSQEKEMTCSTMASARTPIYKNVWAKGANQEYTTSSHTAWLAREAFQMLQGSAIKPARRRSFSPLHSGRLTSLLNKRNAVWSNDLIPYKPPTFEHTETLGLFLQDP
jgi:hypothetical protein